MAIRLGRLFGNPPDVWLSLQQAADLRDAHVAIKDDVRRIKPLLPARGLSQNPAGRRRSRKAALIQ